MTKFFLLLISTTALAGSPVIFNGTNAKFLNSGSLIIPGLTSHGVIVSGGTSAAASVQSCTTGQALVCNSNGGADPSFQTVTASVITALPTVQKFTSSSGTYNKNYTFVITSGSAAVGATYTNNAVTFTVWATVASATQVVMSGSGAPASSGTLTKASGTGDATLTFSQVLAPRYLWIRMAGGGGGGGGGSTNNTGGAGGTGGTSTFGSSLLTAVGGDGGSVAGGAGNGGAGGTATVAAPAYGTPIAGNGGAGIFNAIVATPGPPSMGHPLFGGGARGGTQLAGATNSGAGGSGGTTTGGASAYPGGSGGSGGGVEAMIPSPSAAYAYAVGASGSAGTAGTGGGAGGAGGNGYIEVWEFY